MCGVLDVRNLEGSVPRVNITLILDAKCWGLHDVGISVSVLTCKLLLQESLSRVGIDPTAALARARSQSRGRKRVRSEGPADVEMSEAEQPKRLHSSKSRYILLVKTPDEVLSCQCMPGVVCQRDSACVPLHTTPCMHCILCCYITMMADGVKLCLCALQIHVTWPRS